MIDTPPLVADQQGDPYKWNSLTVPLPKSATEIGVLGGGSRAYYDLLESKIKDAETAIKADLNRAIFGAAKPERNPLRQAIADACDQVTFDQALIKTMDAYKTTITDNIFTENSILKVLREEHMTPTNPTVEALDKRRLKIAKRRVKRVGNYIDSFEWADGEIVRWSVTFDSNVNKTYHYVALKGGNHWYITGDGNKYNTDGLIGRIADLARSGVVIFEDDEDKPL